MNDKNDKISRRNLLKGLGAAGAMSLIHERIVNQIVGSLVSSAYAAPGMLSNFHYVNFSTHGGLARWYFDLPIIPNGNDPYTHNPLVITRIKPGTESNPIGEYAHTKMGDYYLPLLWSYPIPLSNGGVGTLNELASSGLFIRGILSDTAGHDDNLIRQNTPITGAPTFTGIFADSGDTPIPTGYNGNGNFTHLSAKGKAYFSFNYRQDLKTMSAAFDLFKTSDPKSFNRTDMAQRTIEAAIKSIQKTQGASSPYLSGVKLNRDNAMELLSSNFSLIDAEYTILHNKYQSLINASLKMPLPNITTVPLIAKAGDRRYNLYAPDLGSVSTATSQLGDLQRSFDKISASSDFAHAFALAEFLITKNLSSSVIGDVGFWKNFNGQGYNNGSTTFSSLKYVDMSADAHETGTFPSLIMFSRHFHTYATCLNEFVTVLKAKDLYDQTVIHTTSDFNRAPRMDASGSDHGPTGSSTSLFSGRIKKTMVVGNIAKDDSEKLGTWGSAAINETLGGREIIYGNVASTICAMFELPSPAKNDAPLVTLGPDKTVLVPTTKPKNIA